MQHKEVRGIFTPHGEHGSDSMHRAENNFSIHEALATTAGTDLADSYV